MSFQRPVFGNNRCLNVHLICMWFVKTSLDIQSTCNDLDITSGPFLEVKVMVLALAHTGSVVLWLV